MDTTNGIDPWTVIPDGEWTLVKDANKGELRPGVTARLLLLGGSVAHGNFVPAILEGVIHSPEHNPGALYIGPNLLDSWSKFQIVRRVDNDK